MGDCQGGIPLVFICPLDTNILIFPIMYRIKCSYNLCEHESFKLTLFGVFLYFRKIFKRGVTHLSNIDIKKFE